MNRRKETNAVKKALKKAGITAVVTHVGKYRENLKVDIEYPPRGDSVPIGYGAIYTTEECYIQGRVERIVREITGRPERGGGDVFIRALEIAP